MGQAQQKRKGGCLRTGLIVLILVVSVSGALLITSLRSGLYSGVALPENAIALKGGIVWDGQADTVVTGATVLISSGEIICLDCEIPPQAQVIDLQGKTVMPGLIDMHANFYAPSRENAEASRLDLLFAYLKHRPSVRKSLHASGITTIRSVGDVPSNILKLRELIDAGEIEGPDVYCTGPVFTAPDGHPAATLFADDPALRESATREMAEVEQARTAISELASQGVDGIHIEYDSWGGTLPRMDTEVLHGLIAEAKSKGLWIAVSTGTVSEITEAISAGATTIERGSRLAADSIGKHDQAFMLVPVLGREADAEALSHRKALAVEASAKGIAIGSGSGIQDEARGYADEFHNEMERLAEAGIPPLAILKGATSEAAMFLKADHLFGTLESGKRANLIVVDGKPWEQISDIRKVRMVIQQGRIVLNRLD